MDLPAILYIALIALYRLAENWAMTRSGSRQQRGSGESSALLIIIPYYLVLVGPLFEHFLLATRPGALSMFAGGALFAGATFLRAKAHLDLGKAFSMYLEAPADRTIVRRGLYAHIRHPLYLANMLLFFACPIFLQCVYSWLFTLLGVVGVLRRIRVEERFLRKNVEGYDHYAAETRALIPGLY